MSDDFATRLAQVRARYVERLAQARAELAAGPSKERLIFLAHNLAGSGATYGYAAVSAHALALETALNNGDAPDVYIRTLLVTLRDAVTAAG